MAAPLYNLRAFQLALVTARLTPRAFGQLLAPLIGFGIARRNPAAHEAIRKNLAQATGLKGVALEDLCAANIANFSRMLADYFYYSSRPPRSASPTTAPGP